jgi:hypothetical protein
MFEFKCRIISFCFPFIFVSFGESYLLVSWCAGGMCGMTCSDEHRDRSRRPGADDRGWSHRSSTRWLGDREVGWVRVRYALCTWRRIARVSWWFVSGLTSKSLGWFLISLCLKTDCDGLSVVWPQNHWDGFCRFGLKTCYDDFYQFGLKICCSGLASKPAATISDGLASKPALTVSWFVPQNHCDGFLV